MPPRYFELLDDVNKLGRWELSDPTDQHGREVDNPWMFRKGASALETDEPLGSSVQHSWQQRLLERVGDEVAEHEWIRERLKVGMMSQEVSGKDMPAELVTEQGRVGVLLGIETGTLPRSFDMPAGAVRLVTLQVLLPVELGYLLKSGKQGLEELAQRFKAGAAGHMVRAQRQPVV